MLEEGGLHGGLEPRVAPADDDDVVSILEAGKPGHRASRPATDGI
jgi:hypothetical protein